MCEYVARAEGVGPHGYVAVSGSAEAFTAGLLGARYLVQCMHGSVLSRYLAEVSTGHPQQFMTSNYSQGTSSFIFGL